MVFSPALPLGVPSLGELVDVDLEGAELAPDTVRDRLAAVCPPGIELADCAIVRLPGHPLARVPDVGLGKLIDAVDLVIRPAVDGIAHDAARLERICAAFAGKSHVAIARGDKVVDVRSLVAHTEVLTGDAAERLCSALDWPTAPALIRARVAAGAEGSAKPAEVAKALGVWGSEDPRGEHALVARLGVVASTRDRQLD
jgi:hypothetical protein